MSYLPELRASLVQAADRQAAQSQQITRPEPRSWSRPLHPSRWRLLLISVALVLGAGAVALAAAGFFAPGKAVGPEVPPVPTTNDGAAIPTSVKLLPLAVADPHAGPPWGLRVLQTTRAETCIQIGRLGYGTIGVLGQDDAFANDHRFHPLSANYEDPLNCATSDAHGNGFLNVGLSGFPASALFPTTLGSTGGCLLSNVTYSSTKGPQCPPRDVRDVYFGLLGPDAVSITYRGSSGRLITTPTAGTDGAYLLVRSHHSGDQEGTATVGDDLGPGPILAVRYRDGHTCQPTTSQSCPPVGFVMPAHTIAASQVATPISVRQVPARSYCAGPHGDAAYRCGPRAAPRVTRLTGGPPELLVEIRFRSRVAIPNSRSYYELYLTMPRSRNCTVGGLGGPTRSDIRAGQLVTMQSFVPHRCPGVVRGVVDYFSSPGPAGYRSTDGLQRNRGAITVGRFSFSVTSPGAEHHASGSATRQYRPERRSTSSAP